MNKSRVGIYLRLSDEDKNKVGKDSESIKNQRSLLLEEINKRSNFVLVDEYCDEDLSGAGTYRPEFERLIKDCEDRKLDIVMCKSQSRFSRDMEIIEKYIHNKFLEWNIRFISISDNADTLVIGNKKSRQINGLVNEWYLEDVSNNIRSAFLAKMKQGEFISPFVSYGYLIDEINNNKLKVDLEASQIVKEIFSLYLKGYGYTYIAKYLNNKAIPSPSLYKYRKGIKLNIVSNKKINDIKWSSNAIKRILTNELYIGNLIQGKRTTVSYKNHKIIKKDKKEWIRIENTHEAIIDKETFNKVQKMIKERNRISKKTNIVHNFSGKVFCLECKSCMRKKNSRNHSYLVCSYNRDGYDECKNKRSIRYDILEKVVLDEINIIINKYYDEEYLKELVERNTNGRFIKKIKSLEQHKIDVTKKISETRRYLKELYEDKVNGIVTPEQFAYLVADYNSNENVFNNQIKSIDNEIDFYKMKETTLSCDKKIFSKYKVLSILNRVIIDEFIEKIYIGNLEEETNTRDIEIKWDFE